jgi:hypothetical protein
MGISRGQPSWKGFQKQRFAGLRHGFRSGLEEKNAQHLKQHGIPVVFEKIKIKYVIPATERTYTPDFELPNGIIVETKGKFEPQDRAKHLYIKLEHPSLDIRFVFQRPNTPISPGSKITYAGWAERHGFKWATGVIPIQWTKENGGPGPTGPRTIAVPDAAKNIYADSARQPLKAGQHPASGNAAKRRTQDGAA